MKVASIRLVGALIFGTGLVACKFQVADPQPAIVFADSYFEKLKAGDAAGALSMYEVGLLGDQNHGWSRLLTSMQSHYGNVQVADLQSSAVAPKNDAACYWLTYNVTRGIAKSVEHLLICPRAEGQALSIAGHELSNPANGQHISVGTTVKTDTVSIGHGSQGQ